MDHVSFAAGLYKLCVSVSRRQMKLNSCSRTCKLVDWLLWERVLIGRLSRLVLVLRGGSGQVSLQLLVLLPLLLLVTQTQIHNSDFTSTDHRTDSTHISHNCWTVKQFPADL